MGRLDGARVLVVGAGTQPSADSDAPMGNGRAISVAAAREGAAVVCADRDADSAEATAVNARNATSAFATSGAQDSIACGCHA